MKPIIGNLHQAAQAQARVESTKGRVEQAGKFILRKLSEKQSLANNGSRPLVVGINGPQGSGKTTLVRELLRYLRRRSIKSIGFSLDDLYLPYAQQQALAQRHRDNPLLKFRGQPGTHDLELGRRTLEALLCGRETAIPAYDKSRNSGYGDRVPPESWERVSGPVSVVLFEGWNLGFSALSDCEFSRFWKRVAEGSSPHFRYSRGFSKESLQEINEYLKEYDAMLYRFIDSWVVMRVAEIDVVYRWRKEQEDEMRESGRPALTDHQLEVFVSRFMPGYELAYSKPSAFRTSGLLGYPDTIRMHLDENRCVVAVDYPRAASL